MEKYLDLTVTASVRIKFDDDKLSILNAYELAQEQLNTHLELNDSSFISIEDVRLDGIEIG